MSDTKGNDDLTIDPGWVDGVYTLLGGLELELDPDPLVYGPKRLNAKVAEARNMLRKCESVFLQVSHDLHRFSRTLRVGTAKLKLAKDYLFANDPETRAGRNVADREAIATMKLQDKVKEVHRLEIGTEDLKSLMVVIKAKRADLRDAQGRLRDQIRLCQEEIGLGGRWGSQRPNAPDIDPESSPIVEMDDIDRMLQAVDGEMHLSIDDVTGSGDVPEKTLGEQGQDSIPEVHIEETVPSEDPTPINSEGFEENPDELWKHLEITSTEEEVDSFLDDDSGQDGMSDPTGSESDLDSLLSIFD